MSAFVWNECPVCLKQKKHFAYLYIKDIGCYFVLILFTPFQVLLYWNIDWYFCTGTCFTDLYVEDCLTSCWLLLFSDCFRIIGLNFHYHFLVCSYIFNLWHSFWLFYHLQMLHNDVGFRTNAGPRKTIRCRGNYNERENLWSRSIVLFFITCWHEGPILLPS